MKIVIPVAGKGVRLRPYTDDLPKCLLPVGGKAIVDWIEEDALRLKPSETIFVTGYLAEKFDSYLAHKPEWGKTRSVSQRDPQGLGEAVSLALPFVEDDEPLLIVLGDTLFEADLSILNSATENVLYTYKVKDPRRFGVAVADADGEIRRLEEKPQTFVSDEAIVGIYYIRDVKKLRRALTDLIANDRRTCGEFQLTDALQAMIDAGCKFRTAPVKKWLDCGLAETLLDTNAQVLKQNDNSANMRYPGCEIIAPCSIGKNVKISASRIGPNVAIGDGCEIRDCELRDAVVWAGANLQGQRLNRQIVRG